VSDPVLQAAALAGVGFVAAVLNTIAGGGSFLTLPVLIFFGLPATEANATNRLGVLVQNVGAVWGFQRHRILDWRAAARAALPALVGAAFGAWLALHVADQDFRRILATLMVVVTVFTLTGAADRLAARLARLPHRDLVLHGGYLAVGVYAGFVQAGVGFFVLALTTLAGLDLVRGNALKVFIILLTTALSLALFVAAGKVQWIAGAALAVGSFLGSQVGVRLTVARGQGFVRAVVTVALLVFAVLLWRS